MVDPEGRCLFEDLEDTPLPEKPLLSLLEREEKLLCLLLCVWLLFLLLLWDGVEKWSEEVAIEDL